MITTPSEEREIERARARFSQSVSLRVASKVFYLATRLFLPPLILGHVTLEEYGIWASCFIVIGYLGMSAFGVSNVYIRYTAEYNARGETGKLNQLISTGLAVTITLSGAMLIGLWFALPFIISLFKVSAGLRQTAFVLIYATAATFLLDLTFGAFAYVLHGLQRMREQTIIWVATFCLEAVLIVLLLRLGFGVYGLMWAFVVRYVVATAAYIWVCYRVVPGLSPGFRHVRREALKLFYGYGAVVQLSGLLSMMLYSAEKVLAGVFIGAGATGLFDVGEKFPVMTSQIAESVNTALLPALSHLHSMSWREEVARLYLNSSRYMNMLMGFLMGFMAAFASPLLVVWVGAREEFAVAATILSLFTLPYQMNVLTGPGSALHRSANRPARELVYPGSQMLLVLLTTSIGIFIFGPTVIVIGAAVAVGMVLSAAVYICFTNKVIGVFAHRYVRQVILPGLCPYLVGAAVLLLTRPLWQWAGDSRPALLLTLALAGAIYCLAIAAVFYEAVCSEDERSSARSRARALVDRLTRARNPRPAAIAAASAGPAAGRTVFRED